jgi:phosphatidylserine decarboxylase
MASALLALLRLMPQHLLSRAAGRAAAVRLPRRLRRPVIGAFARACGVDLAEVPRAIESYVSVQEFFTRTLAEGMRPIDPRPDSVVAPCDGLWGAAGAIEGGMLLQVKGRSYALAELLGSEADAARFADGSYATFYLGPRNYHRFHAPCDLRATALRYLPGALWPVNRMGVQGIEALFARNERLCAFMEVDASPRGRAVCMVAVGATMVGKVRVEFDDLETNDRRRAPIEHVYDEPPRLPKGKEIGRFEFGSTIVLLAAAGVMELEAGSPDTLLVLGTRIGRLIAPA